MAISWASGLSQSRPGLASPSKNKFYKHNPFKYCSKRNDEEFIADNELFVDKNDVMFKAAVTEEKTAPLELLRLDSEVAS
jgi:hypothetical protein